MKRSKKKIASFLHLLMVILLLKIDIIQALPKIEIDSQTQVRMNKSLEFYSDDSQTSTFEQIRKINPQEWNQVPNDNFVFDLEMKTVWVKFEAQANPGYDGKAYIELHPVFIEKIEIYNQNGSLISQSGSVLTNSVVAAFPTLHFKPSQHLETFYIRLQSRGLAISMTIRSQSKHDEKQIFDLAIFAFLLGGLFSLIIYHGFLFFTHRYTTYLYYSIFVSSIMLFTITFTSYHRNILPDELFGFQISFWWSALAVPVLLLGKYLFSASLLGLFPGKDLKYSNLSKLLILLPVVNISCIVAIFAFDNPHILAPIRASVLLFVVGLPAVAIFIWRNKKSDITPLFYATSWIPFIFGALLVVLWVSGLIPHQDFLPWSPPLGVLVQSVLLSFVAGNRLNIILSEKMAEQNEKLRVMKELEKKVEDLKNRDKVITSYVNADVVEELDRGEDPLRFKPKMVSKCVSFIDMHGYTTFSERNEVIECHEILNTYFGILSDVTYSFGGRVDKIIGDALMITFDEPQKCIKAMIESRVQLADVYKRAANSNELRIKFGMGISYGPALLANFGTQNKIDRTIVGDTVNVASRMEALTRGFEVDILCSKEVIDRLNCYEFSRPAGYVLLKGKAKKSLVYEIFEHNSPAVIYWKQSTLSILETVVDLELNGEYEMAIRELQMLVNKCPRHTIDNSKIMDPTLNVMIKAIEDKVRLLPLNKNINLKKVV